MKTLSKNVTVLPRAGVPDVLPSDPFREGRFLYDLARLANNPGLFQTYVERVKVCFTKAAERAIVEHWVAFYKAGGSLIEARLEMERKRGECLQLANELTVKAREKEVAIAAHEADIAEHKLRKAIAEYKQENLERFVEGGRPETPPEPPQDAEPKLTPDQQRRLKRIEIEDKLRELERLETDALKEAHSEEDRVRVENMYANRREELREQLAKHLV